MPNSSGQDVRITLIISHPLGYTRRAALASSHPRLEQLESNRNHIRDFLPNSAAALPVPIKG
jgi:hypothetical protein